VSLAEVWLILAAGAAAPLPGAAGGQADPDAEYVVRLAVARGAPEVRVQAAGLRVRDADVRDALLRGLDAELRIVPEGEGLKLPGVRHRPTGVLLTAAGPIRVDGRALVGEVEVSLEKGRGLLVVNRLPLERYLVGLLGAEMSSSWPLEALKAQAVAARTYFLHRRLERESEPFDLSASTLDQVYKGIGQEAARTREAVEATRGQVLTWGNLPAETLFHACCGGRTRAAKEAFGQDVPYLREVDDPDCQACPQRTWRLDLPLARLAERLASRGELRGAIAEVRSAPGGELLVVPAQGSAVRLSPRELRQLVGAATVPGDGFTWRLAGETLELSGRGRGHGVGLCQWGARGMAERGRSYKDILARFYPGLALRSLF
jgi:stage II sporulation protein D